MIKERTFSIERLFLAAALTAILVAEGKAATPIIAVPFRTDAERLSARRACTDSERWDLSKKVPETSRDYFESFIHKKLTPVRSFAEAIALRRMSQDTEVRYFAEYWISRSLYESKLVHVASDGLTAIASRPLSDETAGVQIAALDCLIEINHKFPGVGLSSSVTERLPEFLKFAKTEGAKEVVALAITTTLQAMLTVEKVGGKSVESMITLLKDSGAHEPLARGVWAARQSHHSKTVAELIKFVNHSRMPDSLKKYMDSSRILMARAFYSMGKFEDAVTQYKSISKSSNELATSLSELSWAYLLAEKYNEAIGTAMSMQAGGLRNTFAPEAPMVMAMALNEICQYPESVKAINTFRKFYEGPYKWLSKTDLAQLYPVAIDFIRKKNNQVPIRIATEWIRSPVFISHQDELNLMVDEKSAMRSVARNGAKEQKLLFDEIIKFARELKPKYKVAKMKLKEGQELPGKIQKDLLYLKAQVAHFRQLQKAAPIWHVVTGNYKKKSPGIETRLIASINKDLGMRSKRMMRQLEEIAENTQLIEVEIYNGATEDIIWQNAHPEYKKVAKQMKDEHERTNAAKVWNWGTVNTAAEGEENTEIWEDELGSFKADLFDNCSSKDRYLALKKVRPERRE